VDSTVCPVCGPTNLPVTAPKPACGDGIVSGAGTLVGVANGETALLGDDNGESSGDGDGLAVGSLLAHPVVSSVNANRNQIKRVMGALLVEGRVDQWGTLGDRDIVSDIALWDKNEEPP